MISSNEYVLESNHLRTRSSPWLLVQDESLILNPPEEKKIILGSILPKMNKSSLSVPIPIKPPSLIIANPFLKAAKKIDLQTASIPWDDFSNTLKKSKNNISRLKEIYRPARSEANLKIQKKYPTKINLTDSQANNKIYIQKNSENTINSYKNLSNSLEKNVEKSWTCLKTKSFVSLSKTVKGFSVSAENKDQDYTVKNNFFEPDRKFFNSLGLKKCRIKIKREVNQSLPSTSDGVSEVPSTAPFAIVLKGNRMRRNSGNMFIPVSSGAYTPNHFMKKAEYTQ